MDVPAAANILGTLGAVCWSIQLLPQIIINYRRHDTTGLQPTMMMLWAWAGVPLGVYNIVEEFNIALQIQPQVLTLLSLVTWMQCFYYDKKWTVVRCLTLIVPVMCIMAGVQAGLIVGVRLAEERHIDWPATLMAVISAVLLAAGVLRHYVDVYLYRSVRGISFIFVGIDALGDVFSLMSVVFQPRLDILGMVIYGTELVLWMGIFICGAHYNLVPWAKDRHSKRSTTGSDANDGHATGVTLHDLPSSTSVFRTTSAEVEVMRRGEVTATADTDLDGR